MKKSIILILLLASNNIFAQKEAYNWFFGLYSGFTFNTPSHIPQWIDTKLNGRYSCTSISDSIGNLLFYSNGYEILNFRDENLGKIAEYSECALILKKPNTKTLYSIFHTLYQERGILLYSTVDMSCNNGRGKIIEKSIILDSLIDVDKLSATSHENGKDIWIAVHQDFTNVFYLYLMTDSSIVFHHADTVGKKHL